MLNKKNLKEDSIILSVICIIILFALILNYFFTKYPIIMEKGIIVFGIIVMLILIIYTIKERYFQNGE